MAAPGEDYRPAYPPKTKPHLSSGIPFPEACAHHITNTFKASRVYIIVSNSISKTENFTKLEKALVGKVAGVRKGIKPHTPWDDLVEIIQDIKEKNADSIVTLGGGSLTDGAKVITFALANDISTLDGLYKLTADAKTQNLKPITMPVINIPTSLSGGEYSAFAGATNTRNHHKASFSHPTMGADIIILDPALSTTTPRGIWLSTGIRGVDHCVEGLCSLQPTVTEETEKRFSKGLKLLAPNLLLTAKDWEAEEPRLQEHLGVVEAMGALGLGVPMGGSHGIGHQLGPLGVGHGETSCIMLPAVLKYNYLHGDEKVRRPQQKVLDILWGEETVAGVLKKRGLNKQTADAGDAVGAIISELGMPTTLKSVGVKREQLDALAVNCLKDRWLQTNAIPLTEKKQVLEILEMVVGDGNSSL
ncbi:Dehydroquinate synthase-like protein [Venustampulla echinocandica]|uniref:Dehydroquinate synthase-like protein n=1 Tax=Venustampulla echinocandica TaxID=2656787 RepID=A0A370TQU2_9HELO|nr:Dehydroquinate synthase-like protein [Venustampulla echinocandica]RDL37891.1 Dehydroquinate synthase-like protein [Venustampulla echinocandica]